MLPLRALAPGKVYSQPEQQYQDANKNECGNQLHLFILPKLLLINRIYCHSLLTKASSNYFRLDERTGNEDIKSYLSIYEMQRLSIPPGEIPFTMTSRFLTVKTPLTTNIHSKCSVMPGRHRVVTPGCLHLTKRSRFHIGSH